MMDIESTADARRTMMVGKRWSFRRRRTSGLILLTGATGFLARSRPAAAQGHGPPAGLLVRAERGRGALPAGANVGRLAGDKGAVAAGRVQVLAGDLASQASDGPSTYAELTRT